MDTFTASVNFTDLGPVIPFRTDSDALLAIFIRSHTSVDVHVLNDFIALLRTPDFDSTKVTFDNVAGINSHIAMQWQDSIHERAYEKTYSRPPVPLVVVELVADYLVRESPSIFAKYFSSSKSYKALLNMALVHRSWTSVAQWLLRRRIVSNPDRLGLLRYMPQLGPWVREFRYHDEHTGFVWDSHVIATNLVEILRACPNIRDFRVVASNHTHKNISAFDKLINELPHVSCLERLCFEWQDESPDLRLFLSVLPRLTKLKTLTLKDWTDGSSDLDPNMQIPLDEIELPGPALTSLSYKAYRIKRSHLLPFIFRSCGLTSLEIPDTSFFHNLGLSSPQEIQAVDTVLSRITNFRFHVYLKNKDCFSPLLECTNLRRLTIFIHIQAFSAPILMIPGTLEHLWVHYMIVTPDDAVQDGYIVDTIQRLPNLKTLTITSGHLRKGTSELMVFEELPAYCSEKGIELSIELDLVLPPFE